MAIYYIPGQNHNVGCAYAQTLLETSRHLMEWMERQWDEDDEDDEEEWRVEREEGEVAKKDEL